MIKWDMIMTVNNDCRFIIHDIYEITPDTL